MAKVLIVDDKKSNLFALENVLQRLNVEVVRAMTGEDALRATLNHDFALAILDVQMPVMDGYELATLMRGDLRTRNIPIIFLSAVYSDDPYVFKGYESGGVDFITKPFNAEVLRSKVKVFLELNEQKAQLLGHKARLETLVSQLQEEMEARKRVESELLKAKKLEAIGILAGGIAHDFNNLLVVILGNIEMARMHAEGDPRTSGLLDKAINAVSRAKELSNKFITFSEGGSPRKRLISVKDLIKDADILMRVGTNMDYEYSLEEDLWKVEVDRDQLSQVIRNLMTNAWEASPRGRTIKIHAVNLEIHPTTNTTGLPMKEGRYVRLSITDQGSGIRKEDLERVFDPYFSTKDRGSEKGMGLGLTIAHSIVARHGGYIHIESERGVGTSSHIYLPAHD